MPLTPEDVSNKRFTTVRLREGYDMTEVDQFLDEVESELSRLTRENTELRTKLAAATGEPVPDVLGPPVTEPGTTDQPGPADEPSVQAQPTEQGPAEQATVAVAAPVREPSEERVPPMETLTVTTTAEASAAATRLLELAGRNADQLVSEARQEAEQIVDTARRRGEELDTETAHRRETAFSEIEREREQLDREVGNLRTFEREYRAELKSYFEDQLAALEGQGSGGVLGRRDDGALEEASTEVPHEQAGDEQQGH